MARADIAPAGAPGALDTSSPGSLDEPQVRAMFDRIAGLYDRMNSVMTAGLHHQWRRRAADLAELSPGGRALDVATGTGDLALELAASRGAGRRGRRHRLRREDARAGPRQGRRAPRRAFRSPATRSPSTIPDDAFDAATVGFGARNFSDLERGLSEMARVVRPGGRVVVLEITTPRRPPLSTFFELWFDHAIPAARAHRRLAGLQLPARARSGAFPARMSWPRSCGAVALREIRYVLTAGGIIALHVGMVPT